MFSGAHQTPARLANKTPSHGCHYIAEPRKVNLSKQRGIPLSYSLYQ